MKKLLITLLKILLSLSIVAYLVWKTMQNKANANAFQNLWNGPKDWSWFGTAFLCYSSAVLITFVRWWFLARAVDIPVRLRDSIRISFWGYLFNLAPLGIVGGDIGKTVMLGIEHPTFRARGLASVLADRVIGLYILFVVVTVAILLTGFWRIEQPMIPLLKISFSNVVFLLTGISTVGLAAVMGPDMTQGRLINAVGRIPRVGPSLKSVVEAIRLYNTKPVTLFVSCLMSVGVHCLIALACYMIARGLPGKYLDLSDNLVIVPMSNVTGVIPLPMGPFEYVLDVLYKAVADHNHIVIAAGQGFVVALAYRAVTVMVLLLGIPYYFGNRSEIVEVIHEAEEEEHREHEQNSK
jgi:glycosyltransferase 2 family protein